nr:hypothetical protein [Pandoravirus aubagnensis]
MRRCGRLARQGPGDFRRLFCLPGNKDRKPAFIGQDANESSAQTAPALPCACAWHASVLFLFFLFSNNNNNAAVLVATRASRPLFSHFSLCLFFLLGFLAS